jgi:hypothetical protein
MNTNAQVRQNSREAVAVFDDESELLDVIEELESSGFDHSEMSVMPSLKEVEKHIGRKLASVEDAEDDPDIPRKTPVDMASFGAAQGVLVGIPLYIGAITAIVNYARMGAETSTIIGAACVGGAIGGVIGLALAGWVRHRHARHIKEQIDHGGLLLWVRIRGKKHEETARSVIADHIVRNFHMHGVLAK